MPSAPHLGVRASATTFALTTALAFTAFAAHEVHAATPTDVVAGSLTTPGPSAPGTLARGLPMQAELRSTSRPRPLPQARTRLPKAVTTPLGTVLWKADAEAPIASEWASNSSIPAAVSPPKPNATRIGQRTFRAQGRRSYRVAIRDGDASYGERAELGHAMPAIASYKSFWFREGEDRWVAMQYFLPTDWPADDTWQTVLQIKPVSPGGGGPNMGLDAGRNRLMFYGNSNVWGSTAGNIFDGAGTLPGGSYPVTRGRWIKLTWHIVFSANPAAGSVEVFGDLADGRGMRTLVPHRRRATMKLLGNGATDPAHLRVGIYRDPAMTGPQHLFVDGITVATTRGAAEASAYAARGGSET